MSDTPRNDSADDDKADDVFGDPTAPSDAPSYGPPSPSGPPEPTEQLPGGDTQQVPAESSVPPPPPAPPFGGAAQNPYASPAEGAAPQNPYASPPAGQPYPSQGEVADQYGAPGTPAPPGYGQAPGYGQPPGYGQTDYGTGATGSLGGSTIALLVVAGLLTIGGCGTGIPGLVFAIIAVTKKDQPTEMAKWTRWGWIAIVATVLLVILAIGALIGLATVSTGP